MRGVVAYGPRDIRIEAFAATDPGPDQVRVRIAAGGICGSDLHYYHQGGFGTVRLQEPMVLGHEISGTIDAVGSAVTGLAVGTRVAVNPSLACDHCDYCRRGTRNHCRDMRFMGSAMRNPHVQGGFRQSVTVHHAQAVPIADSMTLGEAAMAEPLAVGLHAVRQAGSLVGKRVLVTGCGPIGALLILAVRQAGAAEIIATDVSPNALRVARQIGADQVINIADDPQGLASFSADKGSLDVLFEASGNQAALRGGLEAIRPCGVIVQLGLGGEMTLPVNLIVAKELQLRGSFRFDAEFNQAVELMGQGLIDVRPVLTTTIPFERAIEALDLASDRAQAMKVQLAF